ncbi:flagellar hook-length control protein FliK [Janthinobacterium sp. PAMC25594]|uniref:flagellar hook-length control protein FliK n=1 Tax=Janthinobacterium sp. PAMC25594 TaxID=2861284 RepID=UPI001C6360B9|nr:flagellar hook-length control protein FliK [Janthinobacterium sp. PAMC25594]QYG08218.1 flagellar hook-length control protein FliK [Janthinobacterium sp. PAMC25594]
MKMSFNTTPNTATTPSRSADAGVNAPVSKGAPDAGTPRNLLFSLPAPAQGTVANDAVLAPDLAADLPEDGVPATDAAADITEAATKQDAGLPAMTPPLMAPMLPVSPQADAAAVAVAAKGNDGVADTQQGNAQQTLGLNSRLHPDALAFNVQTARMVPARDLGEPVAAAQPTPASATGGKTALPAAGFDAAPAVTAAPAAAAPAATRDGERVAATPVSPGPVGGVNNGAPATPGADTIKLNGPSQQWQEPLREALGERLQTQIGRNSEHATIRLDPPLLGRIEISIRHTAGALQVNVTASNSEVLRQLQGIGENMRSDLAQRQYTDVAVNISATPRSPAAQAFAEGDARGQRQPGRQNDDAEPGRALSDGSTAATTYAMHERDTA